MQVLTTNTSLSPAGLPPAVVLYTFKVNPEAVSKPPGADAQVAPAGTLLGFNARVAKLTGEAMTDAAATRVVRAAKSMMLRNDRIVITAERFATRTPGPVEGKLRRERVDCCGFKGGTD